MLEALELLFFFFQTDESLEEPVKSEVLIQ